MDSLLREIEETRERASRATMGQGKAWAGIVARWTRIEACLVMALDCQVAGDLEGAEAWKGFAR